MLWLYRPPTSCTTVALGMGRLARNSWTKVLMVLPQVMPMQLSSWIFSLRKAEAARPMRVMVAAEECWVGTIFTRSSL